MIARLFDSTIDVPDDTGRPVRLVAGEAIVRAAAGGDARAIRIQHQWGDLGRDRPSLSRPGALAGLVFGVLAMVLVIVTTIIAPSMNRWYWYAPVAFAIGIGARPFVARSMRRWIPDLIRPYLQESLCPACAYDLVAQSLGETGCVRCPECGATWRGDRFAAPVRLGSRLEAATKLGPVNQRVSLFVPRSAGRPGADDRGRPVRAVLPPRRGRYIDLLVRRRSAAARRRAARGGRWVRWPAAAVLLAPGVFLLVLLIVMPAMWRSVGPALLISPMFVIGLGLAVLLGDFAYTFEGVSRAMCEQGLCPQCGEDIAPLPRDPDGLTTCPGCRAAWRIGDRRV